MANRQIVASRTQPLTKIICIPAQVVTRKHTKYANRRSTPLSGIATIVLLRTTAATHHLDIDMTEEHKRKLALGRLKSGMYQTRKMTPKARKEKPKKKHRIHGYTTA